MTLGVVVETAVVVPGMGLPITVNVKFCVPFGATPLLAVMTRL